MKMDLKQAAEYIGLSEKEILSLSRKEYGLRYKPNSIAHAEIFASASLGGLATARIDSIALAEIFASASPEKESPFVIRNGAKQVNGHLCAGWVVKSKHSKDKLLTLTCCYEPLPDFVPITNEDLDSIRLLSEDQEEKTE